jgi:hypothetical protein
VRAVTGRLAGENSACCQIYKKLEVLQEIYPQDRNLDGGEQKGPPKAAVVKRQVQLSLKPARNVPARRAT